MKNKPELSRFSLITSLVAVIIMLSAGLSGSDPAFAVSPLYPSLELASINFTGKTNGVFSPGGTYGLIAAVTAVNQTALNPSMTLSSSDACVTFGQNNVSISNIAPLQNADNTSSPFQFSISSSCPAGHLINLTLTLNDSAYSSSPIIVPVLVSIPSTPYITPPYTCVMDYFVSTNGSDSNAGTSMGQAWHTIAHAITYLKNMSGPQGGICVNVQPGTYNAYNYASGLSGSSDTPTGYLVFRSMVPYGATIQVPAASASNGSANDFRFDQAHFIVIDGFNLIGQVIPGSIESGVSTNSYGAPGDHIKIINNIIADHGGAGIGAVHTDYLDVQGNTVFGNANTSPYEVSGISTWQAVASDQVPGFHNIISDNVVFNNSEVSDGNATHSDGNGIIIDDFRNTQNNSTYGDYAQQTLIENNLSFGNGGKGIHIFLSDNVTVRNNTTMGNAQDPIGLGTWRAEIDAINGANNTFVNNIAFAKAAANEWNAPNYAFMDNSTNSSNVNNVWHNNLSFNGTVGQAAKLISGSSTTITSAQGNILGQDPKFLNPSSFALTLQPASPAIMAGTNIYGFNPNDLAGNTRTAAAIDIGAYQFTALSTYPLSVLNTGNGFGMIFGTSSSNNNLINCGVNSGATICGGTLNSGTAVTLTAAAANGSTFSGWTVTGSPAGTCTGMISPCVVTVTAATNISAEFDPQSFTLIASADSNASISPANVTLAYGASQTFTITPNAGYAASLTLDGNPVALTGNSFTLNNVTSAHSLVETSTLNTFAISATADSNATITPAGTTAAYGSSQTFIITPNTGYTAALTVDGNPVTLTNNSFTLSNITSAHSLVETSTQNTYTITATSDSNAAITPAGATVAYGGSQTFVITPNTGYDATLTLDGNPVVLSGNSFTLSNITGAHSLVETSTLKNFTITAAADSNATITPAGTTAAYGSSQTFIITPNTGYTAALTVDGNPVTLTNNSFTLSNITSAHSLVESSTLNTYTVTATADSNATISPAIATVAYGGSQTFVITPNTGYDATLTLDGNPVVLSGNNFTLSNITGAHSLVEISTLKNFTITAAADSNATITPAGITAAYGSSQTFIITPNAGYTAALTVDGNPVALMNNSFTLSNITSAHSLVESSTLNTYTVTATADSNATISPAIATVAYGGSQTFVITANAGYAASLTVDGNPVALSSNSFTLSNITGAHSLVETSTQNTYSITTSADSNSTISPAIATVAYGNSQTFTVTPNDGYTASLTVDGVPVTLSGNNYTLSNVTGTHALAVISTQNVSTTSSSDGGITSTAASLPTPPLNQIVTVNAGFGVGGIILPYGKVNVNYGADQTFTIKTSRGFIVSSLIVDGQAVALTNNTFTLNNVTCSHNIKANFIKK